MAPTHQVRTIFRSATLSILDYRCSGEDNGRPGEEWPAAHEITLTRLGAYRCRQALGTAVVDANQLLFFNKGQGYEISHPLRGVDHSTIFVLAPAVLLELLRLYDPAVDSHADRPFQRGHLPLPRAAAAGARLFPFALPGSGGGAAAAEPLAVEVPALSLLATLLAGYGNGEQPATAAARTRQAHRELVEAVQLLLNGRLRQSLSLAEIAAAVHTSPYHLCRLFKSEMGYTINAYLLHLRLLAVAEQMVEEPAADLAALALSYRFATHSHLSTAFRQAFGISPSTFRRRANGRTLRELSKILKV